MRLDILKEPDLEFGHGGTHIDVRHGLLAYGPLDSDTERAPRDLRVGVVGTSEAIEGVKSWFLRAREGLPSKESKLTSLFPAFPGFSRDSCFGAELSFHDRWCGRVTKREIDAVSSVGNYAERLDAAVELFLSYADDIVSSGAPAVVICAPPAELLASLEDTSVESKDTSEEDIDESGDDSQPGDAPAFHDLLKARGMRLGTPLQMIRPSTYGGQRKVAGPIHRRAGLQDPATRAWNLHVALYYKAGGTPWRLVREWSDLSSCFVGISFYRSLDRERLLTSVAQVFNERGEGVIVKGGPARLDKDDRRVQLATGDAHDLLLEALRTYRREHKTAPARVVVHKTSEMVDGEIEGFRSAADQLHVEMLDLLSVKRSFLRLFREGTYPPLRGSLLSLEPRGGVLYTKGSVDFFRCYPGMYVPRPLEFWAAEASQPAITLASELFALTKLNWNNTQFDGGEPITVGAARRVGDILKCIDEDGVLQNSFRFFI